MLERGIVEFVDTGSLVSEDHLLRKVDGAIDFGRLYKIVEPLYSEDEGRPSIRHLRFIPFGALERSGKEWS